MKQINTQEYINKAKGFYSKNKQLIQKIAIAAVSLLILYFIITVLTSKPELSEETKLKLKELDSTVSVLRADQIKYDEIISSYNYEIYRIDSSISNMKDTTIVIKKYYTELGSKVNKYTPTQVDSFFKKRYNY